VQQLKLTIAELNGVLDVLQFKGQLRLHQYEVFVIGEFGWRQGLMEHGYDWSTAFVNVGPQQARVFVSLG
jgi:hypothetical protein